MGFAFCHFWYRLGVSSFYEGDPPFLARFFCGKALQEGLDGNPSFSCFGQYDRKEIDWFLRI